MLSSVKLLLAAASGTASLFLSSIRAAEPTTPAMSAEELAGRMNDARQGSAVIRTQLEVRTLAGGKRVMQLQIKERRTKTATDLLYLVIWPNEHKGEAVILHQDANGPPSGSIILPPNNGRALKASQMHEGLFGSDLSYQDAVENFFAWKKQEIAGSEVIDRVSCQILESKPDNASASIYAKVRSWIDPRRLVPLRVEKYSSSGELLRRIDTTRVARDDEHNAIPAGLIVHGPGKNTVTELNGARIDRNVNLTDADFTPAQVPH